MSNDRYGILIVDDEFSVRDSLFHWFRKDGFRVGAAENAAAALQELQKEPWDVALLDIKMPGMDGMELLRRVRQVSPDTVVLMLTAHGTVETAVEALKIGAYDYLTKPIDPDELVRVVTKALQHRRLADENAQLRTKIAVLSESDELVSGSPQMKRVMDMIDSLAPTDVTVLIRGESGTGKELVARAIHARSNRRFFPHVAINCGALPESLLESELFGHERGAFTGAQHRRRGKLEQADGGTLFLDEVGSISLRTQVELLRVLETKEFARIGGQKAIRVDFRVVCATNQSLEELVAKKEMREDLYFRINVFRIDLPPLRERDGDVPLLARHFLKHFATKTDKEVTDLAPDALAALSRHSWPGNVRELKNVIERAVILAEPPVVRAKDLVAVAGVAAPAEAPEALGSLADSEKAHIARVLERCGWNISQAARVLEVDRVTLYNKIKKYGLREQ
ncbi:MAG: sigma-54-dependent Fis family transcriptional regulator [Deltaproteobacteria bacterium]|nr:sigma-54-dependent Fis family transcriptional regulator [Deltaproteobacteria bacterium]